MKYFPLSMYFFLKLFITYLDHNDDMQFDRCYHLLLMHICQIIQPLLQSVSGTTLMHNLKLNVFSF